MTVISSKGGSSAESTRMPTSSFHRRMGTKVPRTAYVDEICGIWGRAAPLESRPDLSKPCNAMECALNGAATTDVVMQAARCVVQMQTEDGHRVDFPACFPACGSH